MSADRIAITHKMIEAYNAKDIDTYLSFMTEGACEASYRGAVLREGQEGIRSGLNKMWEQFPQNRADIVASFAFGDTVLLHEKVARAPDGEKFEVMSVYSFIGDKVDRVEFIR